MKQSIIIVDPWQTVEPHDKVIRPWLQDEVDTYCKFLNHVVKAEIYKGTDVYIDASQQIVNKNLDSSIPIIDMQELHNKNYTKNIFCGFHYGRCIHRKANELISYGTLFDAVGIAINLSLVLPADDNKYWQNKQTQVTNYMWAYKLEQSSFESINSFI